MKDEYFTFPVIESHMPWFSQEGHFGIVGMMLVKFEYSLIMEMF